MANYDSAYTGQQIDSAIAKIESFSHTPLEIDTAITKFDSIESSPTAIDDAVTYLSILEGEVLPSQIRMCYDYYSNLTVTEEDINDVVTKFDTVNSQPEQIDDTVDIVVDNNAIAGQILTADGLGGSNWETNPVESLPSQIDDTVDIVVDNNATAGQILTADGNGGSSWTTPSSATKYYHHTAVWSKTVGAITHRWTVEWIDTNSGTSATSLLALYYLSTYYRSA